MKSYKYDIKIIPVSIIYERLFDANLLASEMISGEFGELNLFQLLNIIYQMPRNKLGNVYVNYSEPIDLDQFVEQNKKVSFYNQALCLTKNLYQFQ